MNSRALTLVDNLVPGVTVFRGAVDLASMSAAGTTVIDRVDRVTGYLGVLGGQAIVEGFALAL